MNQYVTGAMIRRLREKKLMTQAVLAEKIGVSDKTVSKWETGKGYPDITLLEPLADALGVSLLELLSGNDVTNGNRAGNMRRSKFYVCPLCGNVILAAGEAVVSCCGLTLPPLDAEAPDEAHSLTAEIVEDEYYISAAHPMEKGHYLSFFAAVRDNSVELVKLYPEGDAAARFPIRGTQQILYYCNRHGLFRVPVKRGKGLG